MKVIIAGSRTIEDELLVIDAMIESKFNITSVVSGCARGVDSIGEKIANELNLQVYKFPADWEKYGKKAGCLRNKEMGNFADALIAIWDKKSRGTKHMIDYMSSLNKPVFIKFI